MNEYGRKSAVQLIQPYHELEHFLLFLEHNLPLIKSVENRYLINNDQDIRTGEIFLQRLQEDLFSQWQLPDAIRSSIPIWDDIVTNRCLFLDVSESSNRNRIREFVMF